MIINVCNTALLEMRIADIRHRGICLRPQSAMMKYDCTT